MNLQLAFLTLYQYVSPSFWDLSICSTVYLQNLPVTGPKVTIQHMFLFANIQKSVSYKSITVLWISPAVLCICKISKSI